MPTGFQTHKLRRQSSNDHNCQIWFTRPLVMEKRQLNHYPIISQWELSVAMVTKPRDRSPQFQLIELPLPKQHLYQIRVILLQWFWRSCHLKIPFLKINVAMATNKMAAGRKTYKLSRQLSNDHKCQIWFTSLQWLWRKCNLTVSPF